MKKTVVVAVGILALAFSSIAWAQERYAGSAALDQAIEQVVSGRAIPGAVLLVGQGTKILHRKAYGYRALLPKPETMTVDTIFDIASLTKVVATTPAIMQLVEKGLVRLDDPVSNYLSPLADPLFRVAGRFGFGAGLERVRERHRASPGREAGYTAR
jgi:CubicO group peptidase (beta-lactamase class C family)